MTAGLGRRRVSGWGPHATEGCQAGPTYNVFFILTTTLQSQLGDIDSISPHNYTVQYITDSLAVQDNQVAYLGNFCPSESLSDGCKGHSSLAYSFQCLP